MFILIVDDEEVVGSLLVEIMRVLLPDARIEACASGADALEVCGKTKCDFVLTDLYMPGMSGVELAARIAELHPDTRVAIMTGSPPKGFKGLLKPFRIAELEAFLRTQGVLE